jgi:hypothetical protein
MRARSQVFGRSLVAGAVALPANCDVEHVTEREQVTLVRTTTVVENKQAG